MKHILTLLFVLLFIASCKKDNSFSKEHGNYLERVRIAVKDSVPAHLFDAIDFSRAIRTKINMETSILKIPYNGQFFESGFLMVETDANGILKKGRLIDLKENKKQAGSTKGEYHTYSGNLGIRSLQGEFILQTEIQNGFASASQDTKRAQREAIVPAAKYTDMPEVIVVGYLPSSTSGSIMSYSYFISLESLLGHSFGGGDLYGGGGGGYYTSISGYGEPNTNGYSYKGRSYETEDDGRPQGADVDEEPAIFIDYEAAANDPAIELGKYISCFNSIPDVGAACSIEIFADIPVDNDPNRIFNFETGSPGHTFIQIKKTNGSQTITQNIGFYPESGWKTGLTTAPIEGKFVDNGEHEFNASLKMNLSPEDFSRTLREVTSMASHKYDIDNFNCTDFALNVFNVTRTDKLQIPLYDIPGNYPSTGTSTPQGLYHTLMQMKSSGHKETSNITIDIVKGWVGHSSGPCN